MSKQEFWNSQPILHCPKCHKKYKADWALFAHFTRVHFASYEEQKALYKQAYENAKKGVKPK